LGKIAWCITGAGHFLLETFDVMEGLAGRHAISCFLSEAGDRVVRIYGLRGRLDKICPGGYYREVVLEAEQRPAFPLAGRFVRGTYDALIVSPASANTVAKVVVGIADTLVTNTIAQAEKGRVPIIIVPSDLGSAKTKLPYLIEREICRACGECLVIGLCPFGAVVLSDGLPRIDLTKCEGCGVCLRECPHGAVSFGQEVAIHPRGVDIENVEKLRKNKAFIVLKSPREIPKSLEKVFGGVHG
jgi:dihydromethanopterin reductase (acceptor)